MNVEQYNFTLCYLTWYLLCLASDLLPFIFTRPVCWLNIQHLCMEYGLVWPLTGWGLTPLVSIQNPDSEKFQEVSERGLASFSVLKKNRVPGMGGKWWEKNRVQELLDSVFFHTISPPCLGLCFFQNTKTCKSSLTHFLKFFRIRVLDTH